MLADDLSGPDIAGRLIIVLRTVKTHIQPIYRQLDVANRYLAVKRARELNLLQIETEERIPRKIRKKSPSKSSGGGICNRRDSAYIGLVLCSLDVWCGYPSKSRRVSFHSGSH
jgi:hypothetical protein